MGQCATQHGGAPGGPPDPPGWRPAAGWLHLLHQRQRCTEEHSGGALIRDTQGEHSVGGPKRSTHEGHSAGALRRGTGGALSGSTQEEHSGEALRRVPCLLPAMLSWALRASSPASKFEAPFARLTDRPCVPCPPWRPCHPIAQQRQVTSPQHLASTRTSISRAFLAASQA